MTQAGAESLQPEFEGEPESANDNRENEEAQDPVRDALQCLRSYKIVSGIPLLSDDEEIALLNWMVKGGRIPDKLELDDHWRRIMHQGPMTAEAQRNYNFAQVHLIRAIAKLSGQLPPDEDIGALAETFAMGALDKIHPNPDHPNGVVVEVAEGARLILNEADSAPEIH